MSRRVRSRRQSIKTAGFLFSFSFLLLQGQGKVESGNLVLEDIPEIPLSVKERTRQYQNTRSASIASWDPAGGGMLIRTRFAETSQLHYLRKPMGARQQITFFHEPVGGGYFCSDASKRGFLFSKDVGGSEYYQIFWFDMTTGTATMLTDGESRNGLGPWSNKGDRFAFTSTMGNGVDTWVYVGTVDGDEPMAVVKEEGAWFPSDWSPDDSKITVLKYVSVNESYPYVVDVQTGEMTSLRPESTEKIAFGGGVFSKDSKGIYITTDYESEFRNMRYYDIATGKLHFVTEDAGWNVTGLSLSHNGRYLAYITNEDGVSRLHLLDLERNRKVKLPLLPVGGIGGLDFSPDDRYLALVLNTPQTPSDIYVLDIRRGKTERWTKSEVGGLNTDSFAVPELVHVKSFDGLNISAFLFKPAGEGPHPVVVYIHGGPEGQYRPNFSSTFQYWINELGLAVLATNVRGSNGYGKSFLLMDNGYKREDTVRDIGTFLDWIGTRSDLDKERVAVYGGSYGGYMVLSSMTHYNDRLTCAVDIVGISNFVTFLENTKPYRRDLRRPEYGDERDPKMRAFLEKISPNNNAHKITKPMFIAQGYNDPRVPVTESDQMVEVIRKNGGD
ncbi:MAG TPA: S9 family peptidase, partial [Candidatus Marinimicrobia bacterium]|nr:S9 family peptidase [Candidatus Neomarinimicrobiota bacterium]